MEHLFEHIDRSFDLSHLSASEFPSTQIQSVGILGGGTAGYFTALALKKCHPGIDVKIIESSKIPVIGVGESTTTEVLPFLHNFLGLDPAEFFADVQPTMKLGIHFDWGQSDDSFNFNFYASHHHESYFYEKSIKNSNWPSVLMDNKKVPVIQDQNETLSFMNHIPFAYHLDNKSLVKYLRKKIAEAGIEIIDTEIVDVVQNDDQSIKSLTSTEGNNFQYDLYIDCSGFRSKLLQQSLNTPFISFNDTLKTDRALIFTLQNDEAIDPFTSAITMDNGWAWKIPMRTEDHYGYVFSSEFCTEEEALLEAKNKFGSFDNYKVIEFKSGRHELAWNKNVFSIGNSYAFIEPLESTAIQTIIHSVMLFCRLMPKSLEDTSSINGINKEIAANWDSFRWFLGAHYKFNQKKDTEFWQWCRENTNLGNATEVLELYKYKAPLSKGHYGTTTGYSAHEALVFNAYSYDSLLFGQHVPINNLPQPHMNKEEYFKKCESYKVLSDAAIDQRQLFALPHFESQILSDLFNDPDSWVTNTPV